MVCPSINNGSRSLQSFAGSSLREAVNALVDAYRCRNESKDQPVEATPEPAK
jgi:hypothetical protein